MNTSVKNWYPDGDYYVFTFAKDSEAVGVRVNLTGGSIQEDEVEKLCRISNIIIKKGVAAIDIGPDELVAISVEDYLSDKYTHPADALTKPL